MFSLVLDFWYYMGSYSPIWLSGSWEERKTGSKSDTSLTYKQWGITYVWSGQFWLSLSMRGTIPFSLALVNEADNALRTTFHFLPPKTLVKLEVYMFAPLLVSMLNVALSVKCSKSLMKIFFTSSRSLTIRQGLLVEWEKKKQKKT